jgi:hypothetical protein
MSSTLGIHSATSTLYGQVRTCWIKRRGYARIPDGEARG